MKLPDMKYADGIQKGKQIKFGGLNHRIGGADGELWDMQNLTGDNYPVLSVRKRRALCATLETPGGLFAWEKLCWVSGTGFYYDGVLRGTVSQGVKTFASLGAYIVILPDKCFYNVHSGAFGSMEAKWSGTGVEFGNSTLYFEEADANTLECSGVDWAALFKPGDAVTVSGCTKHPENNKTPIIREIDGDKLIFYENTFSLDGDTAYTEPGTVKIERTVPELLFLCENENRLWGCSERTIYCSKLGDIFNWNVYDGLDTDAWALEPGSPGAFTGCTAYRGYPTFFKEDRIYKIYGSRPSEFQAMGSATQGLAPGSEKSLAVAGETLFYLSRGGVMAYTGGIPSQVGLDLGSEPFDSAAAGSDGVKYYISMRRGEAWAMYVFDPRFRAWHKEDTCHATGFARQAGRLYFLTAQGEIWETGAANPTEGPLAWYAEFGDFTDGDPNKKGVSKLQIRLELAQGATFRAYLQFDGDGIWRPAGSIVGTGPKRSYYLPVIPRRCDHYRLKLTGTGDCNIYSLVRERYSGSEM